MAIRTAALIMASLLAICGILSAAAAAFNPDWFFRSPSTRMLSFGLRRRIYLRLLYTFYAAAMIAMSIRLILDVL